MNIKVSVSSEDILKGQKNHPRECPVALAIERALPGNLVYVGHYTVAIFTEPDEQVEKYEGSFIQDVQSWIWAFDEGKPVGPIDFEVELKEV